MKLPERQRPAFRFSGALFCSEHLKSQSNAMRSSCSVVCSANSLSPSLLLPTSQRFTGPFAKLPVNSLFFSSFSSHLRFNSMRSHQPDLSSVNCTATQEVFERTRIESEFVEVGHIYSVHGLQGEVRVKPSTDFPELRFSKPGRRWLRQQVFGREIIQEIELVGGRGHQGQQSWIIRFNKIDTVDQALKLVGSTVLVSEDDRPEIEEGEFYTRDLVGMKVILKETGQPVGTVVSVFNSGASDLLHVELNSSFHISNQFGKTKHETADSGPLIWVPFVEAIVPDIDLDRRELKITPPRGLLELNIRSDERSKKERRQLEWKERKNFQKRLIATKKKLRELEQQHVFDGFRYGEKSQKSLLADQIVAVNSNLLQRALQSINEPNDSDVEISEKCSSTSITKHTDVYNKLQEKGLNITSHGKVAVILVFEDSEEHGWSSHQPPIDYEGNKKNADLVEALLNDNDRLVKIDARLSVPLILVCPSHSLDSLKRLFYDHNHFAFDPEKVWFLEEERLPVVNISREDPRKHKILMKSPWEILTKPVGSGGVISLLSSNSILADLDELGTEYIELCSINLGYTERLALLGLVDSQKSNAGIEVRKDINEPKGNLDTIFSMNFMKKLTKQLNKLHFQAIQKMNPHVLKVDKEWVDVVPSEPNSLEIHFTVSSCLNSSPPGEVCLLEVTE